MEMRKVKELMISYGYNRHEMQEVIREIEKRLVDPIVFFSAYHMNRLQMQERRIDRNG